MEHFNVSKLECIEMLKLVQQLFFLNLMDFKSRILAFQLFFNQQGISQDVASFSPITSLALNMLKFPSSENERFFVYNLLTSNKDQNKLKISDIEEHLNIDINDAKQFTMLDEQINKLNVLIKSYESLNNLEPLLFNLVDMNQSKNIYKLSHMKTPEYLKLFVNAPKEMIKLNTLETLEKELLRYVSQTKQDLLRPMPNLTPLTDDIFHELEQLAPDLPMEQEWDPTYELSVINKEMLRQLISDACTKPLETEEIDLILSQMDKNSINVVSAIDNKQFMLIVDCNQRLASGILLKLFGTKHAGIQIDSLCKNPTNIHSMEVVNNLVTNCEKLPKEFLHMQITNCITEIEKMEDSENKKRLIRVLCHFLKSLIHNNIIDVNSRITEQEINTFCFEQANINEAQYLFKQIKQRKDNRDKNED